MKTSSAYSTSHSCAVLLVGEPKTGKTSLMMAFPDPFILDLDLNLASGIRRSQGKKAFMYAQPSVDEPLKEKRWLKVLEEIKLAIASPAVKTIAVDGLGVLAEYLCDYIVAESKLAGSNKTGRMEIQNYGDLARLLRGFIMMLRNSGKFIVVTSHQQADKDELTGALRYSLAVPGQTKETLGGLFTDVWATTARPSGLGTVKYEIRTKPTGFHVALGTSFPLDGVMDVTDKASDQVWSILEPKLNAPIHAITNTVSTSSGIK